MNRCCTSKDARKLFLQENPRKAAREIRKAAAFMSLHTELATEKGKRAMIASIRELDDLGNRVERGSVKSASQLDVAFARTHHALAFHHQDKATESWVRRRTRSPLGRG